MLVVDGGGGAQALGALAEVLAVSRLVAGRERAARGPQAEASEEEPSVGHDGLVRTEVAALQPKNKKQQSSKQASKQASTPV